MRAAGAAPCPHFPHCAGCPFIGTPYGAQIERKRAMVRQALAAFPELAHLDVPAPVKSPRSFRYRNQAKLVARRTRRGLLLGIYRPGTHQVTDITRCPVHREEIERALVRLRDSLEREALPVYDERSGAGWLRYVVLRASAWQRKVQVILVATARRGKADRDLAARLRRAAGVASVVLNVNPSPGNAIYGQEFVPLAGDPRLREKVGGLVLQVSPGSFLQANLAAAARLYRTAASWVAEAPGGTAVDLYCGLGALTFHLAPHVRAITGVEEAAPAVADAVANARRNGFGNTRFVRGDAGTVLRDLAALLPGVDWLAVNPPRKGLGEDVRETIAALRPARLLYVSCDPLTLARDLGWLAEHGARVERLVPFDFFPQTPHVECLALLTWKGG